MFASIGAGALAAAALLLRDETDVEPADGDRSWQPDDLEAFLRATRSPVADPVIAVTTDQCSVPIGAGFAVAARSIIGPLDLSVFRLGWYAGSGGRRVWHRHRVGAGESFCTVADVAVPEHWRSGLYLVVARPAGLDRPTRCHPFVVTDPNSDAQVVFQVPFATYQAYNAWGGASLYDFNSPQGRAVEVGLDRPYDVFDGAGFLYYGDLQLVQWLDRTGVDVTYASSTDTHTEPGLMTGRRLFMSNFHDEYWTAAMRDHLEQWIAGGANAAFFGANNIYWQIELDLASGGPTMRCDKATGGPQGTFRSRGVDRPEHRLLGSQYEAHRFPYGLAAQDWIVHNPDHWIYDRTGLRAGDRIARLVGYEWDRLPADRPEAGVTVIADSPLSGGHRHHACVVEHPGGGVVFNAGTNYWPRLLTGGGHWPADAGVARMTSNLIRALGS